MVLENIYVRKALLLLIPVTLGSFLFINIFQNFYYITWMAIVSSFVLFRVFPWISTMTHRKPIYFDDLVADTHVDSKMRFKFQKYFALIQSFLLSLFVASLADYLIYRLQTTQLSKQEILGLFGGLLSILNEAQNWSGRFLLKVLIWRKHKHEAAVGLEATPQEDSKSGDLELGTIERQVESPNLIDDLP